MGVATAGRLVTNPLAEEHGAGPLGKCCRTCKHVRGEAMAERSQWAHLCTKAEVVIDLAFAACGEFNPVLTDDIGQRASDESRARERAERDAKIAAHPELFC